MANGISADYSHLDYSIYDLPTSSNYFSSGKHDSSSDSDLPELVSQNDPRVIQYLEEKKKFQEFQAKEQKYLQMQETCLVYHECLVENALVQLSIDEYEQYESAVAKGEIVPQKKKFERVLTKYPSCHGCYLPWCAECLPTRAVQSPNNIFSFQSMEEKLRSTLDEPIPAVEATSKWLCFVPTIPPVQGKRKARKKKPKSRR